MKIKNKCKFIIIAPLNKRLINLFILKIMKKRYTYSLLYGIPGLIVSILSAAFAAGLTLGFFWLFLFGDTMEWPSWTEWSLPFIIIIVFVIVESIIVVTGFKFGKKQEGNNLPINRKHFIVPLVIIVFFLLYIVVILKNSDSSTGICRDMCIQEGYKGDGLSISDGVCSCYDSATQTSHKVGNINEYQAL